MLNTTTKEAVRTRIGNALSAIATLKSILNEAMKDEDYLSLNVLAASDTLWDISNTADNILSDVLPEPETRSERIAHYHWCRWAYKTFPETAVLHELSQFATQDYRKLASEN